MYRKISMINYKVEVSAMNELIEFLTSREITIVYIVAIVACLLCVIIYLVEKNEDRRRKRHNTRELNKLVEQVQMEEEVKPIKYDKPVIAQVTPIEEDNTAVGELISEVKEKEVEKKVEVKPLVVESIESVASVAMEPIPEEKEEKQEEVELQYTSIEPDQKTAQLELKKLTEELRKAEQEEKVEEVAVNNYEEAQEENAIISLEELVKKGKDIYETNEKTQYIEEGTAPISIQELEEQAGKESAKITEPFVISSVVDEAEVEQELMEEKEVMVMQDFNTVNTNEVITTKKFKSSPFISPVYGIENKDVNSLALENTANYEKLDQEIKKTNEFLMTLRELQKKLDE